MALEDESVLWAVEKDKRVQGLLVVMLKRAYVLPWAQFLYAEGTSEEVRGVFSTHNVIVRGSGLASLLSDFAAQHITMLKEPGRTDKFIAATGPRIVQLEVVEVRSENSG